MDVGREKGHDATDELRRYGSESLRKVLDAAGADLNGHGILGIDSKTGTELIHVGAGPHGHGLTCRTRTASSSVAATALGTARGGQLIDGPALDDLAQIPIQVTFPIAVSPNGWARVKKTGSREAEKW